MRGLKDIRFCQGHTYRQTTILQIWVPAKTKTSGKLDVFQKNVDETCNTKEDFDSYQWVGRSPYLFNIYIGFRIWLAIKGKGYDMKPPDAIPSLKGITFEFGSYMDGRLAWEAPLTHTLSSLNEEKHKLNK